MSVGAGATATAEPVPNTVISQGRYKTKPSAKRAASTSALHRLADPLTGHDSMEALTPEARRRRQESVQRVSDYFGDIPTPF